MGGCPHPFLRIVGIFAGRVGEYSSREQRSLHLWRGNFPKVERLLSSVGKFIESIYSRISSEEEVKPHRRSVRRLLLFVCYALHTIIPLRCSEELSEGW